jgi:branched-chain amino acid transport system substrate-binding protein
MEGTAMKKRYLPAGLLTLLLVVVLGVFAAACGGTTTTTTAATTTAVTTPATTSGASTTAPPATEGATTTSAANTTPIKVGHIYNMTGPEATVGALEKTGFNYGFASVNNQIMGRPVVIIDADSGGSPATAVDVAKKLVEQDHVAAIFGPTEIGEKAAVAGYCKEAGIPLILYNPSPTEILTDNKWVVASGGTVLQPPSCMGDYLFSQLHYKTIVTLTEDNSAGRAFMDPLTAIFTKEGGTVVKQVWVAEQNTDFGPYLTTLPDADCLVAWETGSTAIAFLTQWFQTGTNKRLPVVGAFHGGFLDPFVEMSMDQTAAMAVVAAGASAPQMWAPDNTDPLTKPVNDAFMTGFQNVAGYPPGDDGSSGPAQAALLFVKAVEATGGDTSPDKLLAALTTVSIVGPNGPMSFGGKQAPTVNIYIEKIVPTPNPDNAPYLMGKYQYQTIYTYKDVPPEGFTVK